MTRNQKSESRDYLFMVAREWGKARSDNDPRATIAHQITIAERYIERHREEWEQTGLI